MEKRQGSDLVFLDELCYSGERIFQFGNHVISCQQRPRPNSTSDVIWPSSIRLANLIFLQYDSLFNATGAKDRLKVLELGSGASSILSRVCSLVGMDITASDLPEVVEKAQTDGCAIKYYPLNWNDDNSIEKICTYAESGSGQFDLVLGADILYKTELHTALRQTFSTLLSRACTPQAFILLCWQLRNVAAERQFFESLSEYGMMVTFIPRTRLELARLHGPTEDHFKYTRVARIMKVT